MDERHGIVDGGMPPMRPVNSESLTPARSRAGIVTVSAAVGVPLLLLLGGGLAFIRHVTTNAAAQTAEPVTSAMEAHGADLLSSNGDSGYGPDNLQPWYTADYEVKDLPAVRSAAFK